ncbi:hypothetical protein [Canibacter zhuwentaonis]|nr:hypothetical protein [Canibacter zhuwentaonis]
MNNPQEHQPSIAANLQQYIPSRALFLRINIAAVAVLGVVSVLLVLTVPNLQHVGTRIFASFMLFAIFTVIAIVSARVKSRRNSWILPVILCTNLYVLGVAFLNTWSYEFFYYSSYTSASVVSYVASTYSWFLLALGWSWLIIKLSERGSCTRDGKPSMAAIFALVAAGLSFLFTVLVTARPIISNFGLEPIGLFLNAAMALFLFSGIAAVMSVLLAFTLPEFLPRPGSFWERRMQQRRRQQPAPTTSAAPAAVPVWPAATVTAQGQTAAQVCASPKHSVAQERAEQQAEQVSLQEATKPAAEPAPIEPATAAPAQTSQVVPAEQSPPTQEVQPDENGQFAWPTLADGTPLPQLPDGSPDFSVPGAPYPPHLRAQKSTQSG